jgi:hypothetical protein
MGKLGKELYGLVRRKYHRLVFVFNPNISKFNTNSSSMKKKRDFVSPIFYQNFPNFAHKFVLQYRISYKTYAIFVNGEI